MFLKLRNLQASFQVPSKSIALAREASSIASGLFLGLLGSLNTVVIAQPSITSAGLIKQINLINKARKPEAKSAISAMNRAQQVYYAEYSKFATTIKQLSLGLPPDTQNYLYRIVPQGNSTQKVIMTATAKRPGLQSYTGAVFIIASNGKKNAVTAICETNQPSTKPPALPKPPKTVSEQIQCPAGSHKL